MRILITGVSGQIGGALVERLKNSGTILACDRTRLDLTKLPSIPDVLDRLAPDLIINPAAYTAVDKAEDEPELARRINGEAPGVLASWAAAHAVPFIHFSTDYVFDGTGDRPWQEHHEPHPLSVYGATKLAGEEAIRASGANYLIVRTSWIYAAQGKNFLRTIARLAQDRSELRIVDDQVGAPTSAALVANALATIIAPANGNELSNSFAEAGGLVHLAAAGETSWHGFATAAADGLKARGVPLVVKTITPIRSEEYPVRAPRPRNSRFDLARLRKIFGITPIPWQEALAPELDMLACELNAGRARFHS